MIGHAVLSPSGATRWLKCPPSARLEQQFPDSAGEAAKEGTLAHSLAELLLKFKTKRISKVIYNRELKEIQKSKYYDAAMHEHADNYALYVLERFYEAQSRTKDACLFLEEKIDLTAYIPEGFGTTDSKIIADMVLDVLDFKYGKGVPVSAEQNKQMMIYGIGALDKYAILYDIRIVRMTIYQPRLDNISVWEIPVEELRAWGETELIPTAKLAFEGKGDYTPGKHCQFCRAKATCRFNADYNLDMAKYEFKSEVLLEDKEVSDILTRAADFKSWIKAVEDHALEQAVNNGKKWPGFKLVEGRSNRQYTDEAKVAEALKEKGIEEDKIYAPREVLGVTALEKALGKASFNEILSPLIIKPQGKPTLAPLGDKRPELNSLESAQQDFANA